MEKQETERLEVKFSRSAVIDDSQETVQASVVDRRLGYNSPECTHWGFHSGSLNGASVLIN